MFENLNKVILEFEVLLLWAYSEKEEDEISVIC